MAASTDFGASNNVMSQFEIPKFSPLNLTSRPNITANKKYANTAIGSSRGSKPSDMSKSLIMSEIISGAAT